MHRAVLYSTKGYILYRSLWSFRSPDVLRMMYATAIEVQSTFQRLRKSCLLTLAHLRIYARG